MEAYCHCKLIAIASAGISHICFFFFFLRVFGSDKCDGRLYVFRLSVCLAVRSILVDVILQERLEGNFFLQIQNKCPFALRDELIRFWRSVVKVTVASWRPVLVNRISQKRLEGISSNWTWTQDLTIYLTELNWFEWLEAKVTLNHETKFYWPWLNNLYKYDKMFYTHV